MLSDLERHAAASQWQQLTDFADFLQARTRLWEGPRADAARYLRFFHGFEEPAWAQVMEHHAKHCDPVTGKMPLPAQPPSNDVPEYEISGVAMQFRLLVGFGAQYTIYAFEAASVFLKDHHGYSAGEWEKVMDFLQAQEENF